MSLNEEERKTLVDLYWTKSADTYREAEIAISNEAWGMAANRIYYACFHAISALFVNDMHPVSTHLGMKIAFGKYYVQEGLASPQQGRLFSQLASLREKADYDCLFTTTREDVLKFLPEARALLDHIKSLIEIKS